MLRLPDPPLSNKDVSLWPWQLTDASSLARAWRDPLIIANNGVPTDRSEQAARIWISNEVERRRAAKAIDLVIMHANTLAGEVGLSGFRPDGRAGLIGWWLHEDSRGKGIAFKAVDLLAEWVLTPGSLNDAGLEMVVARCKPDNVASHKVAERAGFTHAGDDADGNQIWRRKRSI